MQRPAPILAYSVLAAALPADGAAPEWVTVFPRLGAVETRDNRKYQIDAEALLAAFAADAITLPVDVMHQTDTAMAAGGRADAVGWLEDLAVRDGALVARVDWTEEGRALLAARKYRYTSPSFWHEPGGRAVRLKALSLVTSPALGGQPALAAADAASETLMNLSDIAVALGLVPEANGAACLAALGERLENSVPKAQHDAALAALAAARKEIDDERAARRAVRIDALIESALKAKKITPAEKDAYTARRPP